eukprot:GILK01016304.1.p1 GENE.GILK01016304.1~~GILK01016304.1.p1  ORF type:complete len:627 (-),score=98.84 GILK01016304.1:117-1763(-)
MEHAGVQFDPNVCRAYGNEVTSKLFALQTKVYSIVGSAFSLTSPQEIGVALFDKLKLKPPRAAVVVTKAGESKYRTGASVLDKLQSVHPVVALIQEHRQLSRLSKKINGLLQKAEKQNDADGRHIGFRMHTTFSQTQTSTGRLTSVSPNLQNVPHGVMFVAAARRSLHSELQDTSVPETTWQPGLQVRVRSLKNPSITMAARLVEIDRTKHMTDRFANEIPTTLLQYWLDNGFVYTETDAAKIVQVRVRLGGGRQSAAYEHTEGPVITYPADQVSRAQASSIFIDDRPLSDLRHPSDKQSVNLTLRAAFISRPGYLLLSADYCQVELRLLAHFSQDVNLLRCLGSEGDIFKQIAAQWLQKTEEDVTDVERAGAKQVCYGLLYGIGAQSLAAELDITVTEASSFITDFKSQYPGVETFLADAVTNCKAKGFVYTLFGRRRYLPHIHSEVKRESKQAERQTVNSICQASAADLIKMAMIQIHDRLKFFPSDSVIMLLQIHDELLFEVREDMLQEAQKVIRECMENVVQLRVAFPVRFKAGKNWAALQPLD